jgi:mannan endo-1,4-beta-mannosidase
MTRVPRAALAVALVMLISACTAAAQERSTTPAFARAPVTSFVKTDGTSFTVDGAPFRFTGVNIYDAAATDQYSCDPPAALSDDALRTMLTNLHDNYGVSVVRFWAYQTYTDGGRFFGGVDRVIDAARAAGMRVLPVLEDGPGYCTTMKQAVPKAQYRDDTWFTNGYKVPYGSARLAFRDYARLMAAHYRNEPVIMGWSLINEADTSARDAQGRSVLLGFAQDVGRVVHAADPNHIVTLGTQSNGARGASGPDFLAVYGLPEMDFAEVHDWGYWGSDTEPMPGGNGATPPDPDSVACRRTDAPIGCSFAQLARLDKPLFVGEAGMTGNDAEERVERAARLGGKMDAAFAAGAGGYVLWRVTSRRTDHYDITLEDEDPLWNTLARRSAALAQPS